jgi:hypothetical protein
MGVLIFTIYLLNFKQYLSQSPQIDMEIEIIDNDCLMHLVIKLCRLIYRKLQ